jgi:hypothetical protein
VVVKLATLLGLDQDPGEVPGLGPIPAKVARELAADGTWRAWITNTTGTVQATSSLAYTPSPNLAELIRAREPHCRMPGCRQPATRCDLDHTVAWPQGQTTVQNLGPLCRRHHVLKTHYGWRLENTDTTGRPPGTQPRPSPTPTPATAHGAHGGNGGNGGNGKSMLPSPTDPQENATIPDARASGKPPDQWLGPPTWTWTTPSGNTIKDHAPPPF